MASWYREDKARPIVDEDPIATRQAKRAELRDARRRQHEDRAERRRVKDATTPAEPSLAAIAAEARATGQPANLPSVQTARFPTNILQPSCAGIYSEQAAQLANPGLGAELAQADDMDMGDPLLCPVCTEPLCRSVKISGCGHVFCEACLLKGALQAMAQACPLCRAPWVLASLARCTKSDALVAAATPGMAQWRARKARAALPKLRASTRALEQRMEAIRSGLEEVGTDDDDSGGGSGDESDTEYVNGASVAWAFDIEDPNFNPDYCAAVIGNLLDIDPSDIDIYSGSNPDAEVLSVDVTIYAGDSTFAAQLSASLRAITPDDVTTALSAPAGSVTSVTEPMVRLEEEGALSPEGPGVAWSFNIAEPNFDNLADYAATIAFALGIDASDVTVWVNGPDAEGACTVVVSIIAVDNTAAEQMSTQLRAMTPDAIATALGAPSAGSVTSITTEAMITLEEEGEEGEEGEAGEESEEGEGGEEGAERAVGSERAVGVGAEGGAAEGEE